MAAIVYSHSFPSNNLLILNVMETQNEKDRERFILLLTFVPGEGTSVQTRSYNFQRKIIMKISLREIPGLAMTLQRAAEGYDNIVLPYTKFTKSTSIKKLDIFMGQMSQNQSDTKAIVLNISSDNNKIAIRLSKPDSYSLGSILQSIFTHYINKDISLFEPKVFESKKDESIPTQSFDKMPKFGGNNSFPNFNAITDDSMIPF